jgi:hypothetical protein
VFARTIEDAALVAEQMMAYDDRDPDTQMQARPALQKTAAEEPPVSPRLAFVKSPVWDQADEDTKEAFAELVAHLGENAGGFELPDMFQEAVSLHRTIMEADLARSFEQEYARGKKRLSPILREMIERGQKVLAVEYNRALSQIPVFRHELDKVFEWPRRAGIDGKPDILHPMDPLRDARDHPSLTAGFSRHADGCTVGRGQRRRRPAAANGPLARGFLRRSASIAEEDAEAEEGQALTNGKDRGQGRRQRHHG